MDIKDIIESEKRNYDEETKILANFSNILKSYISINSIQDTLHNNGFKGLYIIDENLFSMLQNDDALGFYDHNEKVIVLNKNEYFNDKKIGIHEIGHAYLDGKIESSIDCNDKIISYGKGLEEGAVTLLSCTSNIKDINNINKLVYLYQSKLFQQLDVLYKYSDLKEYDNLLIHLFVKPDTFIPLIKDIYENIFSKNYSEYDCLTMYRSALAMVVGNDLLVDYNDKKIYNLLNCINAIYLNVADKKIRHGEKENKLFANVEQFRQTREDILLEKIFAVNDGYYIRQLNNLDISINALHGMFEEYSIEEESKKMIKK